jgi:hypothetical protein
MNMSSIFLGMAPSKCRPFLRDCFKSLLSSYSKLVVPCVGNFTIPQIAVAAGWRPDQIFTSDISLYSTVLARAINDTPISDLAVTKIDNKYLKAITENTGELSYAEIFILMKLMQLNPEKKYEAVYIEELLKNTKRFKMVIDNTVSKLAASLKGINYEPADIRDEIKKYSDDPAAAAWINPPFFRDGYGKMFDSGGAYDWKVISVPEFDWKKEYAGIYAASLTAKANMIFYNAGKLIEGSERNVIFIMEKDYGKREYVLSNKPDDIPQSIKTFKVRKELKLRPLDLPIFGDTDRFTKDSTIKMISVKTENALYYRNLWLHKLGQTNAEAHTMWLMDGKIFAVCGFQMSDVNMMKTQYVFECYGFGIAHPYYPNLVRLLMMCLCTVETKRNINQKLKIVSKNPLVDIKGIATVCLSKYRKVKLNNGILRIDRRERLPNGFYKTHYIADFEKKTYNDCIVRYLKEVEDRAHEAIGESEDEDS